MLQCQTSRALEIKICIGQEYVNGVDQSVYCLTADWMTGVRFLAEEKRFSPSLCVQTSSDANSVSYPMGTGGKARPGFDADHSPPSSAEVRNQ
jgi:hypothetical protein